VSQADTLPSELEVDEREVYEEFVRRGWCDGLPFVPPTPERVRAMVAAGRMDPARSFGLMPPLWRECTVEKIAANTVMAGCLPEYFPVVLAAVFVLGVGIASYWRQSRMATLLMFLPAAVTFAALVAARHNLCGLDRVRRVPSMPVVRTRDGVVRIRQQVDLPEQHFIPAFARLLPGLISL